MCSSGNIAAHATAKSVIASANRLIEVRHCWRKSSRIAEISVPAWPMPIHQTKLMMSNAQPTGMLLPQIPMPVKSSFMIVMFRTIRKKKRDRKPEEPADRRPVGQDDAGDLVGDRPEGMARLDHGRRARQQASRAAAVALPRRAVERGLRTAISGLLRSTTRSTGCLRRRPRRRRGSSAALGLRTSAR